MQRLLIPLLLACLFCTARVNAQVPVNIQVKAPLDPAHFQDAKPDAAACGNAGTCVVGPLGGTAQSNDASFDPATGKEIVYLCFGDILPIDHNGDFDLSGDPVPATPPGIGFLFYNCKPTITGPDYNTIVAQEPCFIMAPGPNKLISTAGTPNGDTQFSNTDGSLQLLYGVPSGSPIQLWFAPVTLDEANPPGFENGGPCVDVNVANAISVVYLNKVDVVGVSVSADDDCIGKFTVKGGLPEFDKSTNYSISVTKQGAPNVEATFLSPNSSFSNGAAIFFSIKESGTYDIVVEDGKSCGFSTTIDMNTCVPDDNVIISFPDTIGEPGSTLCVPVKVQNFDNIASGQFSIQWDPTILSYLSISDVHPSIGQIPPTQINSAGAVNGVIGVTFVNDANPGQPILVADNDSLFNVCFQVVGPLDSCTLLSIASNPTGVSLEDLTGIRKAVTPEAGTVCVKYRPVALEVTLSDSTCLGTANINVTALNGIPVNGQYVYQVTFTPQTGAPFSASINGNGNTYTRANQPSGTYEVCVTDQQGFGMKACTTIVIDVPTLGINLVSTKQPSCKGAADGIVTASVTLDGVSAPPGNFNYQWSGPVTLTQGVPAQTNVPAGSYNVTVTVPTTGCSLTSSGTLSEPAIISLGSQTINPASCSGVNDGNFQFTAKGGTPYPGGKYDYKWTYQPTSNATPVPIGTSQDSTYVGLGRPAGFYQATVTDSKGCTSTFQLQITNERTLSIDITNQTSPSCAGGSDGSICIDLNATPPFGPTSYSFFWSGGTTPANTDNSSCNNMIAAGTYMVEAREDTTGCFDTLTIVLTDPPAVAINVVSKTDPTCTNPSGGSITVLASGGASGTYTYAWSDSTTVTPGITGLSEGSYTVTATDANSCTDTLTIALQLPAPPAITQIDTVKVKCGKDGSLTVIAPTATFFEWRTLNDSLLSNTAKISNLDGGTYVITIRDANNCETKDTITLPGVATLAFLNNTAYQQPSCNGYEDGIISIGASGGTGVINIKWSNGQEGPSIINVGAGSYTAVVTDQAGCSIQDTFNLSQPPAIVVQATGLTAATCATTCDGKVVISAFYDTKPNPTTGVFFYGWSDSSSDSARVNLCAGLHEVTVSDNKNCFVIDTVIIGSPDSVKALLQVTPPSCFGTNNGSITALPAGGNGAPFTFVWSSGATTPKADSIAAGDYEVTITDNKGCTGTAIASVTAPAPVTIIVDDKTDPTCFGSADGQFVVSSTGGTAPLKYNWSQQGSTNVIASGTTVSDLKAGVYSVTVTDANGCTSELGSLSLIDPEPIIGRYNLPDTIKCFGDEVKFSIDSVYGGYGGPYLYSIDFSDPIPIDYEQDISGGLHTITYYDQRECAFSDTIIIPQPTELTVKFPQPEAEIQLGEEYALIPVVSRPITTVIWTPAELVFDPSPNDLDSAFARTFESTVYKLTVIDENGCSATASFVLNVDANRNVYIPNVFHPGADLDLNDNFGPSTGVGVKIVRYMRIFDRWGNLLFERNDFAPEDPFGNEGWDGRSKGKLVDPGVYIYAIEVEFLDNRVLLYRGDITVIR